MTESAGEGMTRRNFIAKTSLVLSGALLSGFILNRLKPERSGRKSFTVKNGDDLLKTFGQIENSRISGLDSYEIICEAGEYNFQVPIAKKLPAVHKTDNSNYPTLIGLELPEGVSLSIRSQGGVEEPVIFNLPPTPVGIYHNIGSTGSLEMSGITVKRNAHGPKSAGSQLEKGGVNAMVFVNGVSSSQDRKRVQISKCQIRNEATLDDSWELSGISVAGVESASVEDTKVIDAQWDGIALYYGSNLSVRNCSIERTKLHEAAGTGIAVVTSKDFQTRPILQINETDITNFTKNVGTFGGETDIIVDRLRIKRDERYPADYPGGFLFTTYDPISEHPSTIKASNIFVTGTRGVQSLFYYGKNVEIANADILIDNTVYSGAFDRFNYQDTLLPDDYSASGVNFSFQQPQSQKDISVTSKLQSPSNS